MANGDAPSWDEIEIDGDVMGRDCLLRYKWARESGQPALWRFSAVTARLQSS